MEPYLPSRSSRLARGRTGGRNPERTSANILKAAIREFADRGYGEARVDRIAARAGVNKRMLYHYYGSKRGLYVRVLSKLFEDIRNAERALGLEGADPVEGIERLILFKWNYLATHREFISVLQDENRNRARFIAEATDHVDRTLDVIDHVGELLRRGHRAGRFARLPDATNFYITLTGICWFYLSNIHTHGVSFQRNFAAARELKAWGAHVADVMLGWLEVRGRGKRK